MERNYTDWGAIIREEPRLTPLTPGSQAQIDKALGWLGEMTAGVRLGERNKPPVVLVTRAGRNRTFGTASGELRSALLAACWYVVDHPEDFGG